MARTEEARRPAPRARPRQERQTEPSAAATAAIPLASLLWPKGSSALDSFATYPRGDWRSTRRPRDAQDGLPPRSQAYGARFCATAHALSRSAFPASMMRPLTFTQGRQIDREYKPTPEEPKWLVKCSHFHIRIGIKSPPAAGCLL